MALVLASVAAGAIFLPELSSDLWTMRADEIRKTVPEKRVAELQKELLVAVTNSPDWSPYVWSEALSPMLSAIREPLQIQWDLTYDIRVYLDQVIEFAGERLTIHRLDSLCRSGRLLPVGSNSRIWVSLARTYDALMNEYSSSGCLLREQVELPGVPVEKWRDAILQLCYVSVAINGQVIPLEVSVVDNLDVVRWETNIGDGAFSSECVPVTVSVSFPLGSNVTKFPIIFASYYCAGRTEISFSVYHPADVVDVEFVDFCSRRAGSVKSHDLIRRTTDNGRLAAVTLVTAKDSVLWPGSGMLLAWETRRKV